MDAMNARAPEAGIGQERQAATLADVIERSRAMLGAIEADDWEQFHSLMRARDHTLCSALANHTAAADSPESLRELLALNEKCLRRVGAVRSELETRLQRLNKAQNATQRYRQSA